MLNYDCILFYFDEFSRTLATTFFFELFGLRFLIFTSAILTQLSVLMKTSVTTFSSSQNWKKIPTYYIALSRPKHTHTQIMLSILHLWLMFSSSIFLSNTYFFEKTRLGNFKFNFPQVAKVWFLIISTNINIFSPFLGYRPFYELFCVKTLSGGS